ncbi:MAG: helix-turn-helix domain-containing protein [Elusimicrobiota bacterium]|nr:MAG: helix-turn-helix domain-containing protein [Elusimicrobiota bacterium]
MSEELWLDEAPVTEFVRHFRFKLRLSQQELADAAGIDRGFLAKVENGRDPRLSTVIRIVSRLGGALVLGVRSPRPLCVMADDHVAARQEAWLARREQRVRAHLATE